MKELTLKENLMLSPIEKHILYNKFPTRLFLNIMLLVLVTLQVTLTFDVTAAYPRSAERVFRYLFTGSTDDQSLRLTTNSPKDIQSQLIKVQDVFMNFNQYMFQDVNVNTTQFTIHAYYKFPYDKKEVYDIDPQQGFTSPFNTNDLASIKSFFESVIQMEVIVSNLTIMSYIEETQRELCLNWTVNILYDLQEYTQIYTTVTSQSVLCSAKMETGSDASIGVSILVLLVSMISLIRMAIRFFKMGRVFLEIKAAYINYVNHNLTRDIQKWEQQKQELIDTAGENIEEKMEDYFRYQSWEDIPFSAKMGLFNAWFIFNAVGYFFQVISSLLLLVSYFSPVTAQGFYVAQVALGFSVFFTWVQILQYLGFWKEVPLMTTTLGRVAVPLLVFFSICVPIFLGIAILGYTLFWKYDKFNSVGSAIKSLFSVSCGDTVHETFLDTWDEGLPSMIYLIVYVILYYTAFANIFVAIVMEGFLKTKLRQKIDNDDPFPIPENLHITRKTSLEIPVRSKEAKHKKRPELMKSLSMELGNPRLSNNAKNTMNLLLFQNEEVKEELVDLLKIKLVIDQRDYDKRTKDFLEGLLRSQLAKIIKKINYYELMFKRSLESRNLDEAAI